MRRSIVVSRRSTNLQQNDAPLEAAELPTEARLAVDLFASFQQVVAITSRTGHRPIADAPVRSDRAEKVRIRRNEEFEVLHADEDEMTETNAHERPVSAPNTLV